MKTTLIILFATLTASAADVAIFYDASSQPIANKVTGYRESPNLLEFPEGPGILYTTNVPPFTLTSAKVLLAAGEILAGDYVDWIRDYAVSNIVATNILFGPDDDSPTTTNLVYDYLIIGTNIIRPFTSTDLNTITLTNWINTSNALVQAAIDFKAELVAVVDAADEREGRLLRAFAEVVMEELHLHAVRVNAIMDAADNATSLATFKTDVAAIPDIPQRTIAQLKSAIQGKLNDD